MKQLSPEGRVWRDRYFQELAAFGASGMRDAEALENAAQSLEFLLQRDPEAGAFVQRLSMQAAMISRNGQQDLMVRLANNGLMAGITQYSDDPEVCDRANGLLLLLITEARLNAGDRTAGIQALKRLKDIPLGSEPIDRWIKGLQHYFSGRFEEDILERYKACAVYTEAIDHLRSLMESDSVFLQQWVDLVYGPEMQEGASDQQKFAVPLLELKDKYVRSCCGLVRCQDVLGDEARQRKNALAALEALDQTGLSMSIDPFSFISVLSWLPGHEGRQQAERLLAHIGKNRMEWEVAVKTGIAVSINREGQFREAAGLAFEAQRQAGQLTSSIASVFTSGLLTEITHLHKADNAHSFADYFLKALALAVYKDPTVWANPYYRSLFERPVLIVLENMLEEYSTTGDRKKSVELSILLDAARAGTAADFQRFMEGYAGMEDMGGEVRAGMELARDTLGRIYAALPPGALALVLQPLADGMGFLMISRAWEQREWVVSGNEYRTLVAQLQEAAGESLKELQVTAAISPDLLTDAGAALFNGLPPDVRNAMGRHETLLLIPDYSSDGGVVPFELMYDGTSFVGEEIVIARYISLKHLARSLDAAAPQPGQGRALVTPITDATNLEADRLESAGPECEAIVQLLRASKYDIPDVAQQLTPAYYTDRMSFLDILHIAAHGESEEGDEWLLLPNDEKFYVDDLYVRKQRSLPFVYLNTCHLGFTRYLGAGIRRGFAFNLIEAGAPAVIANTIETLDSQTARLSIGFYRRALTMPVGEALKKNRRDMLNKGVSPVIWGSAVLLGDPYFRLPDPGKGQWQVTQANVSVRLLDAFLDFGSVDRNSVWQEAVGELGAGYNPRLEASMLLLQAVEGYENTDEEEKARLSAQLIRLADMLDHLPAKAYFRLIEFQRLEEAGEHKEAYAAAKDLILYLEALSSASEKWGALLRQVQAKKKRFELAFEGRSPTILGPGSQQSDEVLAAALDTIYSAQEQDAVYDEVALRDERTSGDMVWNAIVLGHGSRLEDSRETIAFARQLCRKLIYAKTLAAAAAKDAPRLVAGMLRWLWSVQNLSYLAPEMAEGQSGTFTAFIADVNQRWVSAMDQPWYELLSGLELELNEGLARLDALPYDEFYDHLDAIFEKFTGSSIQALEDIRKDYPDSFPVCSAYIAGMITDRNDYSYVDGSIPETMQKKMDDLYYKISDNQKADFQGYLFKGYETVRNRAFSDIDKWRMGSGTRN